MTDINQFIKDTTTASFTEDVIEASSHSLVIVDFWAPWCGPCKQLTPTLEKMVGEFGGNVLLCKVNVAENQAIAAQMGIQSIPAVFAFRDQKPIDGFMGNITEYVMSQQFLSLLDKVIDSDEKQTSFERHMNRLTIHMDWSEEVEVDEYIIIECYRIIDPDTFTDVYNDYYLKRYATALIKKQWGQNLLKFEGMQMPGGVQFNGRQLYDDALQEIEQLTEEARLNWEQPIDFMTG